MPAKGRRRPDLPGLPDLQEQDEGQHRGERGADIDDPRVDVVRDQELRDREGGAADQDRRPHPDHAAEAREHPDQPERHDQREQRQLPADHRAEDFGRIARHRRQTLDRCAERAEGDRRGVGDQRQAGGGKRREAKADQDRPRDGHRRAEAARSLEEGAEREGDQQKLEAPVGRDARHRLLEDGEPALLDRKAVEEDDVEDDPPDREEARHHAEDRGTGRETGRHAEAYDGDQQGEAKGDDGREMGLHATAGDHGEQRDDRYRSGECREPWAPERIIDLIPGLQRASSHFRSGPICGLASRGSGHTQHAAF